MDMQSSVHSAIDYMMDFTMIYDANKSDIYLRELKCLEKQIEFTSLPPRDGDLFVGRLMEAPIGFLPQNNCGGVGYYCDYNRLKTMLTLDGLSDEEKSKLIYLLEFWQGKTTNEKIYKKYTDEQKQDLTHGDMAIEPGSGFPLYRMSGAQMDPSKLLEKGICGLRDECRLQKEKNISFYLALEGVLTLLQKICLNYAAQCRQLSEQCNDHMYRQRLHEMEENLCHIAYYPPQTFWQALQLAYLFFIFSGAYNYGRMDDYIGSFYAYDIDHNVIDNAFALRLTKSLWSLIIERKNTWDARIILGGEGRKYPEYADRFAMLAIETSRQMHDTLPQLTLRCYNNMNPEVYQKALASIGEGTTYPILYNDEVNILSVKNAFDVDTETAEQYVPFGCGEYVIYNQSFGTPSGAINLLHTLNDVIYGSKSYLFEKADSFEQFYQSYLREVEHVVFLLAQQEKLEYEVCAAEAPFLFYSLLFDDCVSRAKPIFSGGIRYLGGTLETYGNINVSDSLVAIKHLVFEKGMITVSELQDALRSNFKNDTKIRPLLLSSPKYGNDVDEVDSIAVKFHEDLCGMIRNSAEKVGLDSYLAVIINNGMNTVLGLTTGASADGRLANTYMANANNPVGGMDKNGITAMLNSLVKLRTDIHAGAVQNMRFSKEMFGALIEKTQLLLKTYFLHGGSQTMITVLGRDDLEKAMKNPTAYQNLIVRVGGFSARFVDLDKAIQLELLSRTLY